MTDPRWNEVQKHINEAVMHLNMSQDIFNENKFDLDGSEGYIATMAFLHGMQLGYLRIEDGIKSILKALGENIPLGEFVTDGIDYHKDILRRAAISMENVRPAIISEQTYKFALELYRFSRIAEFYPDEFDYRRCANPIEAAAEISKILVDEINLFEKHFNPIKLLDKVRANKAKVRKIVADNGACNPRVFGSAAHREDNYKSDLDLLVDVIEGATFTLLSIVRIDEELTKLLGVKVSVLPSNSIAERYRDEILKEAVPV